MKKLVKISRDARKAADLLGELHKQFADELLDFGKRLPNPEVQSAFQKFGGGLKEVESFRELLYMQLENLITIPLETFQKTEIDNVKEKRKKFTKVNQTYEDALARASQMKKRPTIKSAEIEKELSDAKRDFQIGMLDLVFALNDVEAKKQYEVMERVAAYMYANAAFFHQGHELFSEMTSFLRHSSSSIQQMRVDIEEDRTKAVQLKQDLEHKAKSGQTDSPAVKSKGQEKTIQGYLFKRSSSMRKDWKRRYFVVEEGEVKYFKNSPKASSMIPSSLGLTSTPLPPQDLNPITAINLLLCSVKVKHDIDRRCCFEIISPDKSYILQAETEEKMNEWISVLQAATADLLNSQDISVKKSAYSSSPDVHKRNELKKGDNGSALLAQFRATCSANEICADCSAKDPEWTSINLGVIVCIECSGIHRSMGVHISKVRSFTLDKLEPDVIKLIMGLGNEKANKIFEAKIPADVKKPGPTSDRQAKEKFIRMKYEQLAFVPVVDTPQAELGMQLYNASRASQPDEVLDLIVKKAPVNFVSPKSLNGKSCLDTAISHGNIAAVALLLFNKADLAYHDLRGWTALHYAAHYGRTNSLSALFKNGGATLLDAKDKNGKTALDIAVAEQKADCVTFLRLAQLAVSEGSINDDSFMEALHNFSMDAQQQNHEGEVR
eukprot:TRINITY_DN9675_c0_g1_i1.p1 TRINITY_DN9675_c0_g1~~TRINITY_DN9675_c0_g1_i1.p1  ORF type:complete len:747 (+),score=228.32 TRINITY_DN9675_c0_g1_i1:245-2242(+)